MPEASKQIAEAGEPHVRVYPPFGFDPLIGARSRSWCFKGGPARSTQEEQGTTDVAPPISIAIVVSKGSNDCAS